MRKIFFRSVFLFLALSSSHVSAQKFIKYYDKDWVETARDKAVYYAEFLKNGNVFKCTSYWIGTNSVRGRSTFPDTSMAHPVGLQTLYTKKGKIEDSIYYTDGKTTMLYHYYPNGSLAVHYYIPDGKTEAVTEAYDEDGKKIKNYILAREAEFKGGDKAWQSYLKKNVGKDLNVKDDATKGTVQVQFIVDESGSVTNVKVLKSSGIKELDNDAVRAISDSPAWNNAISFNQPAKAYRMQSITYDLRSGKK
jgi:TonB family protein